MFTIIEKPGKRLVRFDIYETPYVDLQPSDLPMHVRIRMGMTRYAEEQNAKLGLCKNGFIGPKIVWAHGMTGHSEFLIECRPTP